MASRFGSKPDCSSASSTRYDSVPDAQPDAAARSSNYAQLPSAGTTNYATITPPVVASNYALLAPTTATYSTPVALPSNYTDMDMKKDTPAYANVELAAKSPYDESQLFGHK